VDVIILIMIMEPCIVNNVTILVLIVKHLLLIALHAMFQILEMILVIVLVKMGIMKN